MSDHQANRPGPPGLQSYLEHADFRASRSGMGIGAAVWRSSFQHGRHRWDCIVSDGRQHHYLFVTGDLGPRPSLSGPDVEGGLEQFAATLPPPDRLRLLGGASPLRIGPDGRVSR